MTATIKLLSMLVSLAMMLTGASGVEAPEAAARTLTLSNITLTVNGESVTLEPTVSLSAATDGAKALFDVAMHSGDKELFPVQLAVTEEALTALVKNADTAFTVPAAAIDALTDAAMSSGVVDVSGDEESSEMLKFMTEEYLPAYTRALQKAMDPEFSKALNEKAEALLDGKLDRGEGVAETVNINGEDYACTTYTYSLDAAQMMSIADEIYAMDEDLNALYEAIFKLYNMMPEESGLNGAHSFVELGEKTGLAMTGDFTESIADEGDARKTDAVLTLDIAAMTSGLVAGMIAEESETDGGENTVTAGEPEEDAEAVESADAQPAIEPMVFNIATEQVGDEKYSTVFTDYTVEDVNFSFNATDRRSGEDFSVNMLMGVDAGDEGGVNLALNADKLGQDKQVYASMAFDADGERVETSANLTATTDAESGDCSYELSLVLDMMDAANVRTELAVTGTKQPAGTGHSEFSLNVDTEDVAAALNFDADVTDAPVEDVATGHDALVIDDIENIETLFEDETAQGMLMQAGGSLMADAGTLMEEESVKRMVELFTGFYTDVTETREGAHDDVEEYEEYEEEEVEDDGVLPYEMPEFAFIPEGWNADEPVVDTAYDMVSMSFADESYENVLYATFISSEESGESYVVDGEGKLVASGERNVRMEHMDGSWSVNLYDNGVSASLYIISDTVDPETVLEIVNGLTF